LGSGKPKTEIPDKDLVQQIGGKLEKSLAALYPDLDLMKTCAVRLS